MKAFLNSLLSLAYPPVCLHCNQTLSNQDQLLCASCSPLLELIDKELYCPRCFYGSPSKKAHACKNCATKSLATVSIAAALEYMGPASSLIKQLKYGDKPYLAKGLAAFMAAQFVSLDWPAPDFIIPVPQAFSRFLTRGYNQAELLGETLSNLLNCPLKLALKRKSGSFSQAALNKEERLQMEEQTIYLKKNQHLEDKVILLVDDVLTTGTTLQKCAESLMEEAPSAIYALAACYTEN
ncbi:MAG TPA: ComF family protein [Parachlamydiaceae bacterium]|nr:ComF family protein [Parachlamydiaceae bacterium]